MRKWGWWLRAFRDAQEFVLHSSWSVILLALFMAVPAFVAAQIQSKESITVQSLWQPIWILIGAAVLLSITFFFMLLPVARKRHWKFVIGPIESDSSVHSLLTFYSKCFHNVNKVEFTVETPAGNSYRTPFRSSWAETFHMYPGHYISCQYPSDFDAPWPIPGTYKVSFSSISDDGKRRITFCSAKWNIK